MLRVGIRDKRVWFLLKGGAPVIMIERWWLDDLVIPDDMCQDNAGRERRGTNGGARTALIRPGKGLI